MLTRPLLNGMTVEDSSLPITIKFKVDGSSDQVYGSHIEVYNNINGIKVYEKRNMSFMLETTIPANTLVNGTEYRLRVRTYNSNIKYNFSNEDSNNTSQWSDFMILKCFSKPTVTIDNIPIDSSSGMRLIRNQTFTFSGTYSQKEGAGLKSYKFILMDRDKVILQSYNEVFSQDNPLTQEITGLLSSEEYYIKLLTLNQYDIETESELYYFYVDYETPRITQVFDVTVDNEAALVKLNAQISQLLLQGEGDYVFENYSTYIRDRQLSEITSSTIGEIENKTIKEVSTERMVTPLGRYSEASYDLNGEATYSITTQPQTIQDIFFLNLESPNSKVWIDKTHGLNMDYYYTMNLWCEGVLENLTLLEIKGKKSNVKVYLDDAKIHYVEDYSGVIRHTVCPIDNYRIGEPIHLFIQKRNPYIRLKARMV